MKQLQTEIQWFKDRLIDNKDKYDYKFIEEQK
jgi:hypothetical protein